jgi:arylsulfatase A-like enzyme
MRAAPGSLILVTIDCLRADHVGFMGYERPTTPFLDSLASQSFIFKNAIAAGVPTYYSLPAILASRFPLSLGRDLLGLAPDEPTIGSELREHGFTTGAFLAANPYLSPRFGYDFGFDGFRDFLESGLAEFANEQEAHPASRLRGQANRFLSQACHTVGPLGAAYDELYFRYCRRLDAPADDAMDSLRRFPAADVIVDHAIPWLSGNVGRPFFLWLHLMDPHSPYFPKPEALELMGDGSLKGNRARYANAYWNREDLNAKRLRSKREEVIALYDAGIRWADTQIRRLTEKLVELNLWDKCALAVTADHGEEFLEHGGRFHTPMKLTRELTRVPLLLRVPEYSQGGQFESPLSLIDLAPTLLDVMGISQPAEFRGRSCWNQVQKNELWDRTVITECVKGCTNPFHPDGRMGSRILAVQEGQNKLVLDFATGSEQLFDLASDPQEMRPLPWDSAKGVRRRLLQCARRHVAESQKALDSDKRLEARLRDLRLEWAHSATNDLH